MGANWESPHHRITLIILIQEGFPGLPALEGEMLDWIFFGYDCLTTPANHYIQQGRYATRYAALCSAIQVLRTMGCPCPSGWFRKRSEPICVHSKPIFPIMVHPHQAIWRCVQWSREAGVMPSQTKEYGLGAPMRRCCVRPRCLPWLSHDPTVVEAETHSDHRLSGAPCVCGRLRTHAPIQFWRGSKPASLLRWDHGIYFDWAFLRSKGNPGNARADSLYQGVSVERRQCG